MRIPKKEIVFVFAVIRQAELSLDSALKASWDDFISYYSEGRSAAIREALAYLDQLVGIPSQESQRVRTEVRWLRWSIGWLNRRSEFMIFHHRQLSFLKQTLESTIQMLSRKERPTEEEIVWQRMTLFECDLLIRDLLRGNLAIQKALSIEHFLNVDFIQYNSLAEFVP